MLVFGFKMMSDDSENDVAYMDDFENDIYYKKYKLLLERCEAMQKYNERLVFRWAIYYICSVLWAIFRLLFRIQQANKIVQRRYQEVEFLKNRLSTVFGEDWKLIPKTEIKIEDDVDIKPIISRIATKIKQERIDDCKYGLITSTFYYYITTCKSVWLWQLNWSIIVDDKMLIIPPPVVGMPHSKLVREYTISMAFVNVTNC